MEETEQYEYRSKFRVVYSADSKVIDARNLFGGLQEKIKGVDNNIGKEKTQLLFADFTDKEIRQMPKEFKKKFKIGKIKASVRKQPCGVYEIRCQINYHKITATSKLLETAKQKFIEKLKVLNGEINVYKGKNTYFCDYMIAWLETVKKPYIKENTYKNYLQLFNAYITKAFTKRELSSIKQLELQEFINHFTEKGQFRTAQNLHRLLSALFDYAVADEIIQRSPMALVKKAVYEQEHGKPLTREEESYLIKCLKLDRTIYSQVYAFMVYTGVRRAELPTCEIEKDFIRVKTAKVRKGKKEKFRLVPISPILKSLLPLIDFETIKNIPADTLTSHIKLFFKNHHLHDLRHTFITRCQECGIRREIVSLWAGHAADNSITSTVYTHLEHNKSIQLEEIEKFSYDL